LSDRTTDSLSGTSPPGRLQELGEPPAAAPPASIPEAPVVVPSAATVTSEPPVAIPRAKPLLDDAAFERRVQWKHQSLRVDREARRRLDAEENPPPQLPPFLTLAERLAQPRAPFRWRIDGWLPVDARVMLTAQFKAGKTTLVENLIRSLVDGDRWLEAATVVPIAGLVVLVDTEMPPTLLDDWHREQRIQAIHRVVPIPIRGALNCFNIIDAHLRAEWAARLRAINAQYLMLDCLRPVLDAVGLDEQHDAGRFLVAFDALLREAGIPEAAVIHHMGHAGARARGDSRLRDWPDVEWRLIRENDEPSSRRYLAAYGRDVDRPKGLLTFNPAWRRLTLVEDTSRQDGKVDQALAAVVLFLKERQRPASGRQVEDALDGQHARATVRAALKAGARQNRIVCRPASGRGKSHCYSLPATDGAPVQLVQSREV
jgi:hypothetical protein